jgi:excinuclease ABC subunit A
VEMGNTIVTIEHNLDIVKDADYLIDLGPEGGENGGRVIACGSPSEVISDGQQSYTARFLREYLNGGAVKPALAVTKRSLEEITA